MNKDILDDPAQRAQALLAKMSLEQKVRSTCRPCVHVRACVGRGSGRRTAPRPCCRSHRAVADRVPSRMTLVSGVP